MIVMDYDAFVSTDEHVKLKSINPQRACGLEAREGILRGKTAGTAMAVNCTWRSLGCQAVILSCLRPINRNPQPAHLARISFQNECAWSRKNHKKDSIPAWSLTLLLRQAWIQKKKSMYPAGINGSKPVASIYAPCWISIHLAPILRVRGPIRVFRPSRMSDSYCWEWAALCFGIIFSGRVLKARTFSTGCPKRRWQPSAVAFGVIGRHGFYILGKPSSRFSS